MAAGWNRARSAGLERWRGPSRRDRPSARGFARACASCLRCGSWRSAPGRHAGLCHRGKRLWRRCGEGAALQYQYRWTLKRFLRSGGIKLLLSIDADVVDEHLLWENGGVVRRAGPRAANGDVEDNEEGVIENPGAAGGPLRRVECGVESGVDVKADSARLLADVFHDVDFAALRPADGADVIAKHPESGPHSLPRASLDAGFEAAIGLAEKALSFEAS